MYFPRHAPRFGLSLVCGGLLLGAGVGVAAPALADDTVELGANATVHLVAQPAGPQSAGVMDVGEVFTEPPATVVAKPQVPAGRPAHLLAKGRRNGKTRAARSRGRNTRTNRPVRLSSNAKRPALMRRHRPLPASYYTTRVAADYMRRMRRSGYARRNRVSNKPTKAAHANLMAIAPLVQELLNETGACITSGYRNEDVNHGVGGVSNSRHKAGLAVDLGCAPFDRIIRAARNLEEKYDAGVFAELLAHSATPGRPADHVHVGFHDPRLWRPERQPKVPKAQLLG